MGCVACPLCANRNLAALLDVENKVWSVGAVVEGTTLPRNTQSHMIAARHQSHRDWQKMAFSAHRLTQPPPPLRKCHKGLRFHGDISRYRGCSEFDMRQHVGIGKAGRAWPFHKPDVLEHPSIAQATSSIRLCRTSGGGEVLRCDAEELTRKGGGAARLSASC